MYQFLRSSISVSKISEVSRRPILDLKKLKTFKMETTQMIRLSVEHYESTTSTNIKDAYFRVMLHASLGGSCIFTLATGSVNSEYYRSSSDQSVYFLSCWQYHIEFLQKQSTHACTYLHNWFIRHKEHSNTSR